MSSFEYYVQARNPGTYLLYALSALLVGAAWILHAPLLSWVPVLAFAGLILWRIATNPKTGFRLLDDRIEIFRPGEHRLFALDQIDSVALGSGLAGPNRCLIHLQDGRSLPLPCAARLDLQSMRRQFALRGIRVLV